MAGYEVRASPAIKRSLVEPTLRAALADPELRAPPDRFPLVRVGPIRDSAPDTAVRVEFQGYMEGYVVTLTNSVSGWRVARLGRMIE